MKAFFLLNLLFPIRLINLNSMSGNSTSFKFNNTFACIQGLLRFSKAFTLIVKRSPDCLKTLQQKRKQQMHRKPEFRSAYLASVGHPSLLSYVKKLERHTLDSGAAWKVKHANRCTSNQKRESAVQTMARLEHPGSQALGQKVIAATFCLSKHKPS